MPVVEPNRRTVGRLSRAAAARHQSSPFFARTYKSVGIPLAVSMLYPVFGLLLDPLVASAMIFSSLSVMANASRLYGADKAMNFRRDSQGQGTGEPGSD